VACAQYALREGDPAHNLARSLRFIEWAALVAHFARREFFKRWAVHEVHH